MKYKLADIIILLNAPAGAGKDAIGSRLSVLTGAPTRAFKEHLYQCTSTVFNLPVELVRGLAGDRKTKEEPYKGFSIPTHRWRALMSDLGKSTVGREPKILTPREALIYTSEYIIKPTMGKDYFGRIFTNTLDLNRGVIFTDSGFEDEVTPLIESYGKKKVFIVQFDREGCSFQGDSRNYLYVPEGVPNIWLKNDDTIDSFCNKVLEFVEYERAILHKTFD